MPHAEEYALSGTLKIVCKHVYHRERTLKHISEGSFLMSTKNHNRNDILVWGNPTDQIDGYQSKTFKDVWSL